MRAREWLGFAVATAVAPAVLVMILAVVGLLRGDTIGLGELGGILTGFTMIGGPMVAASALAIGIPLYRIASRRVDITRGHTVGLGLLTGGAGTLLFPDFGFFVPALAGAGAVAGWVFWLVARPDLAPE